MLVCSLCVNPLSHNLTISSLVYPLLCYPVISSSSLFPITCPYHLNLAFLTFSAMLTTCTQYLLLISLFLTYPSMTLLESISSFASLFFSASSLPFSLFTNISLRTTTAVLLLFCIFCILTFVTSFCHT